MSAFGALLQGWLPSRDRLLEPVGAPRFQRVRLDGFPRGIDNAHVDACLDQQLLTAAGVLVSDLLREHADQQLANRRPKSVETEAGDTFRDTYTDLTREAVKQARAMGKRDRIQLLQMAVIKLLLRMVDEELSRLRDDLDAARFSVDSYTANGPLEVHERKVLLARTHRTLRYRTVRDLFRLLARVESSNLRKLRKTVLGFSWPFSPDLLDNPFLMLGGEGDTDDFLAHFPMLLRDQQRAHQVCSTLFALLQPWLPDGVGVPAEFRSAAGMRVRRDQGGLTGFVDVELRMVQLVSETEEQLGAPHALDQAEVVYQLFNEPGPGRRVYWHDPRYPGLRKRMLARFEKMLDKAGLLKDVVASYLLQRIYPKLGVQSLAEPLYEYLARRIRRRELLRRLANLPEVNDGEALIRQIDVMVKEARLRSPQIKADMLAACAADCTRLRYHLKLANWAYRSMDGLRVLTRPNEIAMSSENRLLQAFSLAGREEDGKGEVLGHVIIKADVRGSTEITSTMRARQLNPAAYFSLNLYDPINTLLPDFNAEKVFVEGDAVILAIMEYKHHAGQHSAIALACGLSKRILEVVDRKNAESARLNLPLLELGLGIAYSNEAPTFLYDDGRRIMISPAINRADRLSSCNSRLRALHDELGDQVGGIDVVARPGREGNHEVELVRYNVNGIELDAPAFYRLTKELATRRVILEDEFGSFLVGRYSDHNGTMYWLALREAPVRLWVGRELHPGTLQGQRFYEVISDEELLQKLRQQVKRRAGGAAPDDTASAS